MKTPRIPALLFLCLTTTLSSFAALTPYTDAVKQAADKGQYMVVAWNGSDWSPQARAFTKEFEELSKTQTHPVIWCEWDEREHITPEEEESEYFNKQKPPASVWNIPAFLVVSPGNQLVYKVEGATTAQLKKVIANLPAIIENQKKADAIWDEAAKAKGESAALLYDKGLALLPRNVSNERKDILDKVKKEDPEDQTGTRMKADFSHQPIIEKANKMVREDKDVKGAKQYIADRLAVRGLTKDQTQKIMAGYFSIASIEGDKKEKLKQLEAIAKVDPKSEMGRGAVYYYRFLTEPVSMKGNKITGREMRHEFTPMSMDASPYIKSSGKYKIECKFYKGGCDLRNPRLVSGKRVVVPTPGSLKDKNAREFILDVPNAPSKLQLVLDAKGHGWFSAEGEIIITKL